MGIFGAASSFGSLGGAERGRGIEWAPGRGRPSVRGEVHLRRIEVDARAYKIEKGLPVRLVLPEQGRVEGSFFFQQVDAEMVAGDWNGETPGACMVIDR